MGNDLRDSLSKSTIVFIGLSVCIEVGMGLVVCIVRIHKSIYVYSCWFRVYDVAGHGILYGVTGHWRAHRRASDIGGEPGE